MYLNLYMDYDANNKLFEEEQEELKDFWFPKDDSRINNFSTLTTEEQLQIIEIGYFTPILQHII